MIRALLILAALVPAGAAKAAIVGPKVFFIANQGPGQVSGVFTLSGFGDTPTIDVHCNSNGVSIRDLVIASGTVRFTADYLNTAPANFEIIVYGSTGAGTSMERARVEVRRTN